MVALARERHFVRAAASCGVSQPALSEGIRRLEAELDAPLVRRGNKFGGLTAEGEAVVLWARQILAGRDGLVADVAALRGHVTGTLRLGCIPTAANAAPLLTGPFCAANPGARVDVISDLASSDILRLLLENELDGGISYIKDPLPDGFHAVPLYSERYVLLCPASAGWLPGPQATWAEASALPLCLLAPHMQGRRRIDGMFAEAGVQPSPTLETDSVASLFSHVAAGGWATIVPAAWLLAFVLPPSVRALPLVRPEGSVPVGLVTLDREPSTVMASALVSAAEDADLEFFSRLPLVPRPGEHRPAPARD